MQRVDFNADGSSKVAWSASTTKLNLDLSAPDFGTPQNSDRPNIKTFTFPFTAFDLSSDFKGKILYSIADLNGNITNVKIILKASDGSIINSQEISADGQFDFGKLTECPQVEFVVTDA